MKKALGYILVLLLAPLVFYGGAGVNVVSYCCDDCRAEGIQVVIENKCCEVHDHNHCQDHHEGHHHDGCCPEEESCDIQRVDFDWDSFVVSVDHLEPIQFDLYALAVQDVILISSPLVNEINTVLPNGPPPLLPRTYLSMLTTLLI